MQRDTLNKTISLPEAVLLDMDGLLLDTEKVAQRAFFSSPPPKYTMLSFGIESGTD